MSKSKPTNNHLDEAWFLDKISPRLQCVVERAGRYAKLPPGWNLDKLDKSQLKHLYGHLPHGAEEIVRLERILGDAMTSVLADKDAHKILRGMLINFPVNAKVEK